MKRLFLIAAAFLLGLGAVFLVAMHAWRETGLEVGRRAYLARTVYSEFRTSPDRRHPLVVWLGDSTAMPGQGIPAYPSLVARDLRAEGRPVETLNLAQAGADPFLYYCALGRILGLEPPADLVVFVANLRLLGAGGGVRGVPQVLSMVPDEEFWRGALLPWQQRQVTLPRLLLARSLRSPWVESMFYRLEGWRVMFREAIYSDELEVSRTDRLALQARITRASDTPLNEGSPRVRMLGAAVELLARHGIRSAVIVTPVAFERLPDWEGFRSRVRRRVGMLRRVVESAGGRLIDLHDLLGREDFRDHTGHFSRSGAERLAAELEPILVEELQRVGGRRQSELERLPDGGPL